MGPICPIPLKSRGLLSANKSTLRYFVIFIGDVDSFRVRPIQWPERAEIFLAKLEGIELAAAEVFPRAAMAGEIDYLHLRWQTITQYFLGIRLSQFVEHYPTALAHHRRRPDIVRH